MRSAVRISGVGIEHGSSRRPWAEETVELNKQTHIMITLDAFLVFLVAASLPATYILLISRWIEPDDRKTRSEPKVKRANSARGLIHEAA